MDAAFTDLDILLNRIRNPQSKVYFLDDVTVSRALPIFVQTRSIATSI